MSYTAADYVRDYTKEWPQRLILEDRLARLSPKQLQAMSLDEALQRFRLDEVLPHWPFEEVLQKCLQQGWEGLSPEEIKAYLLKLKNQRLHSQPAIFLDSRLSQLSPEQRLQALWPEQQLYLLGFTLEQRLQGLSPDEVLPHFSVAEIEAYLLKLKNQPSH